jgi:catechol 2,3-dioxygenase-like lactoylglutathione lyase family enzyme
MRNLLWTDSLEAKRIDFKERAMLQNSPLYAYIPAKDVTRARKFYEGTLGFRPKEEVAGGVVYEFGKKTACFLYPTPNAGTSRASQAFWQVDDVDREMAELKSRGVEFEDYGMPGEKSPSGAVTAGGAKAAWFKDTEGNILAIIQSV